MKWRIGNLGGWFCNCHSQRFWFGERWTGLWWEYSSGLGLLGFLVVHFGLSLTFYLAGGFFSFSFFDDWKIFYKDSFSHFLVFDSIKKDWSTEIYFSQQKTLIKIRLIFYRLFSKKKKKKIGNQSLSHVAHNSYKILSSSNSRNNIFFCSFNLSHNKISHFFSSLCFFFLSSHILTITPYGFFSSHKFLSLSASLLFFSPLYNTVLK